jgi:hypothetical protein
MITGNLIFVTRDGKEFNDEVTAKNHENYLLELNWKNYLKTQKLWYRIKKYVYRVFILRNSAKN